jgi:tight adherence protein B
MSAAVLVAALAGGFGALAVREALLASPAAAAWIRLALEPLERVEREGYLPSSVERRRLTILGTAAAALAGWFLAGRLLAALLAVVGPAAVGWVIASRRRRYRRRVERALPEIATAIADSLSAGRSLRASLAAAIGSLDGPAAGELAQLAGELEIGAPTGAVLDGWRGRMRSQRVDALVAALLSQRLAGGDLAGLLRRFAAGAAEQERVAEDARSATAQARFTGLLVVAMPTGGALFAELLEPGFLATLLASPPAAVLLALAAVLQVLGFLAIRRLAQVVE